MEHSVRFAQRRLLHDFIPSEMLGEGKPLEDYVWSSYPEYLKPTRKRVGWLRVDRLLGEQGIRQDNSRGRREFREIMAARCGREGHAEEELWSNIRRGWRFGAEDFVERLAGMDNAGGGNPASHLSDALEETMEEKARGVIRAFLEKRGIGLDAFRKLKKGDQAKVRLAGELRRTTTMTMAWIARELNAGVPQTLWKALWASGQKGANTRD